jgi:hypothetical protein
MKKILVSCLCFVMLSWASTAFALNVTAVNDGETLVNNILGHFDGDGISVSNISYSGANGASGLFTDGVASGLGKNMDSGILLTTGKATNAVGPNSSDSTSTENNMAGDSDLNSLVPSGETHDATVLEFDFTTTSGYHYLFLNFVFASEAYLEYVNKGDNDVFGCFLDGDNIAFVPDTTTPVSINNVNNETNSEYFNDNSYGSSAHDLEYDGFTRGIEAKALNIGAGTHHIKIAIADVGDYALDSGVFIGADSFRLFSTLTPGTSVPEPSTLLLLGLGLLGLTHLRRTRSSK